MNLITLGIIWGAAMVVGLQNNLDIEMNMKINTNQSPMNTKTNQRLLAPKHRRTIQQNIIAAPEVNDKSKSSQPDEPFPGHIRGPDVCIDNDTCEAQGKECVGLPDIPEEVRAELLQGNSKEAQDFRELFIEKECALKTLQQNDQMMCGCMEKKETNKRGFWKPFLFGWKLFKIICCFMGKRCCA